MRKKYDGITLVELIIIIALVGAIGSTVSGLFIAGMKAWNLQDEKSVLIHNLGLATKPLFEELISAERILTAQPREVKFTKEKGLLVGTDSGIYLYDQASNRWTQNNGSPPNSIPPGTAIYALIQLSSGRLISAASNGCVYHSDDGGNTWTGIKLGTATSVRCLAVTPDESAIYAGTEIFGDVYKSTDSGTSWTNTAKLSGTTNIYSLTIDSSGTIYAGTNSIQTANLFYSSNGGASWTPVAVTDTKWLYRKPVTVINGTSTTLSNYPVKMVISFVPNKMNADFSDIRFLTETGQQLSYWIESYTASTNAVVWVNINSIPASSSTTIYMNYGNPAASSASDSETTFTLFDHFDDGTIDPIWTVQGGILNESGTEIAIRALNAGQPGQIRTGTALTFGTNYAIRYRGLHANVTTNRVGFISGTGTNIPCAIIEQGTGNPTWRARSRNNGNTTTSLGPAPPASFQVYDICRRAGTANLYYVNDVLTATHTTQVYTDVLQAAAYNSSTTETLTIDWILVRQYVSPEPTYLFGPEESILSYSISALAIQSDTVYAGTSTGKVFKSTDKCASWSATSPLTAATYIHNLFTFDEETLYAATEPQGDVFKTTDGGVTWVNTTNLPGVTQARVLNSTSDGALISGGSPNGDLFHTTDAGITWTLYPDIPGVVSIFCATPAMKTITYSWSGNLYKLTKNPDDRFRRTAENTTYYLEDGFMSALTFSYLKSDMSAADTSNPSGLDEIRIVKIQLTLENEDNSLSTQNSIFLRKRGLK